LISAYTTGPGDLLTFLGFGVENSSKNSSFLTYFVNDIFNLPYSFSRLYASLVFESKWFDYNFVLVVIYFESKFTFEFVDGVFLHFVKCYEENLIIV
jgi:hypothetical protein